MYRDFEYLDHYATKYEDLSNRHDNYNNYYKKFANDKCDEVVQEIDVIAEIDEVEEVKEIKEEIKFDNMEQMLETLTCAKLRDYAGTTATNKTKAELISHIMGHFNQVKNRSIQARLDRLNKQLE
jgi:hypothetical protein